MNLSWLDYTQYISGTATGITIESDDTLQVNADTSTTFSTPLITLSDSTTALGPNFVIKSMHTTDGVPLFTMIGDAGANNGDGWQIKTDTGIMSFSSDHNLAGTYNRTILTLTGHNVESLSTVAVAGKLTVASDLNIEGDIDMATGCLLYTSPSPRD